MADPADSPAQRARFLRSKIADAKLERMKNSGNGLFDPMPSQRAKVAEDNAVYNKMQNLREEEAEVMEQRAAGKKGMKNGGSVKAKGWGQARGARAAKVC